MASTITKKDWVANFTLIGKPVISDFTFEIDKQSNKSSYVYNRLHLGVNCGENHGVVYCDLMGGYAPDNPRPIRKPRAKEDGSADFNEMLTIEWRHRLDADVVNQVADMSLFSVGLEKTNTGKTYFKNFLTEYDAIAYIKECLDPDMNICVRGKLEYSTYNGNTTVRKNITSIYLTDKERCAKFTQSILIDRDSASLTADNIDKDKSVMFVNARVLDYAKEYNGVEVHGNVPYNMQFEQMIKIEDQEKCKKLYDFLYKVKKGVTQLNMEGEFVESGAVIKATLDDLTPDIKALLDCGCLTEDEALAKCSTNGGVERRMVLKNPVIKNGNAIKFEERYTEDELEIGSQDENEGFVDDGKVFDSGLDWLN